MKKLICICGLGVELPHRMHPATVITIFYDFPELDLIKFSLKTIFFFASIPNAWLSASCITFHYSRRSIQIRVGFFFGFRTFRFFPFVALMMKFEYFRAKKMVQNEGMLSFSLWRVWKKMR